MQFHLYFGFLVSTWAVIRVIFRLSCGAEHIIRLGLLYCSAPLRLKSLARLLRPLYIFNTSAEAAAAVFESPAVLEDTLNCFSVRGGSFVNLCNCLILDRPLDSYGV